MWVHFNALKNKLFFIKIIFKYRGKCIISCFSRTTLADSTSADNGTMTVLQVDTIDKYSVPLFVKEGLEEILLEIPSIPLFQGER